MLNTDQQQKIIGTLLKRPDNMFCADCDGKSPCWASLDFGVFVCMNCSGAHRSLGPTVTRIKSTKLDVWNTQWVQCMQLGNVILNGYWQADIGPSKKSIKPNVNSSLKDIIRFVQQKYVKKKYADKNTQDPLTKYRLGIPLNPPQIKKEQSNESSTINNMIKSTQKKQISLIDLSDSVKVVQVASAVDPVVHNFDNFQFEINNCTKKKFDKSHYNTTTTTTHNPDKLNWLPLNWGAESTKPQPSQLSSTDNLFIPGLSNTHINNFINPIGQFSTGNFPAQYPHHNTYSLPSKNIYQSTTNYPQNHHQHTSMSNSFNLNNLNNINNINLNMYPTTNTNTTLGNIMIMPTSLHNNIEINMNPTINLDAPKVVTPTDSSWVNDWK